jgi:hypothetical protein
MSPTRPLIAEATLAAMKRDLQEMLERGGCRIAFIALEMLGEDLCVQVQLADGRELSARVARNRFRGDAPMSQAAYVDLRAQLSQKMGRVQSRPV